MLNRNVSDPRDARDRADGRSINRAHRVLAEKLDLTQSPMVNVQLQIWSDTVDAIIANRRQLLSTVPNLNLKLTTTAFTASFKDGDRTIIVSAVHYQCASSHDTPFKLECPARVIELRGGKMRLLTEVPDFPISAKRGEAGFDASTNSNREYMTVLTFDPANQQIVTEGRLRRRDQRAERPSNCDKRAF